MRCHLLRGGGELASLSLSVLTAVVGRDTPVDVSREARERTVVNGAIERIQRRE